jgi:chromosome segregation ATPase
MSDLSQYQREAEHIALRIRELKSLTPEFLDARDQAQRSVERHYKLIEEGLADLEELRAEAAAFASRIGMIEEEPAQMVEELEHPVEPFAPFVTSNYAETISAQLAGMAINQPPPLLEDRSKEPEMTTEQVQDIEASMAEALKAYS